MSEWKLVYQGGHHDVWCDGESHDRTEGGFVWKMQTPHAERRRISPRTKCSCELWGNPK